MTDSSSTPLCVQLQVGHYDEPICPIGERDDTLMRIKNVGKKKKSHSRKREHDL